MKSQPPFVVKSVAYKQVVGLIIALMTFGTVWGGAAQAEPAQERAKFEELSRQAEQLLENVQSAQLDLDRKLQQQGEAERKMHLTLPTNQWQQGSYIVRFATPLQTFVEPVIVTR